MAMGDSVGWACFHAISAEYTAGVIDVVNASVAFTGGNAICIRVFRGFDVNSAGRAGGGAQKAADAFFQSIFIPLEDMDPSITRLEMDGLLRIIFRDGLLQHVTEGHAEAFHKRDECFAGFLND